MQITHTPPPLFYLTASKYFAEVQIKNEILPPIWGEYKTGHFIILESIHGLAVIPESELFINICAPLGIDRMFETYILNVSGIEIIGHLDMTTGEGRAVVPCYCGNRFTIFFKK